LFCHGHLGLQALIGMHLLQATIFILLPLRRAIIEASIPPNLAPHYMIFQWWILHEGISNEPWKF